MGILVPTDGTLRYSPAATDNFRSLALPSGVSIVSGRRGAFAAKAGKGILVGWPSAPLVFLHEEEKVYPAGIQAPSVKPTLAVSGTGITGTAIGYLTFLHMIGGRIIAESNYSKGSDPLALSNQGRSWPGLPTAAPNPRVNHISGSVSMDGALPRRTWIRELGTASVIENVPTASLGATAPVTASGSLANARGIPPYCLYAAKYYDRIALSGDPRFPYRVWLGEIGEAESFGPLSYIDTRDREAVTGLIQVGDQLVVSCMSAFYDVQGYVASDLSMRKIHPTWGCISHHGMVVFNDGQTNRLIAPSQPGLILYDGSFHFVSEDWRDFWRDDYAANRAAYETSIGSFDPETNAYELLIDKAADATTKSYTYVGHVMKWHESLEGGGPQMHITTKLRGREDTAIATVADGSGRKVRYTGSADGFIRRENVRTNADDDGDTYKKRMVLQHPHDHLEDVGGDHAHGKLHTEHELFLKNEDQEVELKLYAGEESALEAAPRKKTIKPGKLVGRVSRRSFRHLPMVVGHGLTRRIEVESPVGIEYAGDAGTWTDGLSTRPKIA